MALYRDAGICTNGKYAEEDGLNDLQSCFEQCLAEVECLYVSFMATKTCTRFRSHNCEISLRYKSDAKLHITYQKVQKGAFITPIKFT